MQTVILCNKIIPTLSPLCENSPTATLEILGKSLLERQLESLSESGFSEFTVVTGEQGGELLRLTELLKEKFSIRKPIVIGMIFTTLEALMWPVILSITYDS